jgi:hypothetical protein
MQAGHGNARGADLPARRPGPGQGHRQGARAGVQTGTGRRAREAIGHATGTEDHKVPLNGERPGHRISVDLAFHMRADEGNRTPDLQFTRLRRASPWPAAAQVRDGFALSVSPRESPFVTLLTGTQRARRARPSASPLGGPGLRNEVPDRRSPPTMYEDQPPSGDRQGRTTSPRGSSPVTPAETDGIMVITRICSRPPGFSARTSAPTSRVAGLVLITLTRGRNTSIECDALRSSWCPHRPYEGSQREKRA